MACWQCSTSPSQGRAGDPAVALQQLLQQFTDHPGWHAAVACAAGSETCVKPDLLELPATAKPHLTVASRSDGKAPLGVAEKQTIVSSQCFVRPQISF